MYTYTCTNIEYMYVYGGTGPFVFHLLTLHECHQPRHISPIHMNARARTHRNTPGASQRQKKMCTVTVSETTDGFMYASTAVKGFVGSLKSQVSFAQNSLFYRALLQKRPIILRSVLVIATPYASAEVKGKIVWACAIHKWMYEVATISRLLKITGLFCRISSLL